MPLSLAYPRGSGEVPVTYNSTPPTTSRHSPSQSRTPMSSPNLPTLQRLYHLDRSSSGFHDELSNLLYGEEYQQCVPILQGDDLVWLVDYLDKVRSCVPLTFPALHSHQRRSSTLSAPPAQPSEGACANSGTYVAPEASSQRLTRFRLTLSTSVPTHSRGEVMVMCMMGL